jgi:IS605 OrfB family transposase
LNKTVECPNCGVKLDVARENPISCKNCSLKFNVVTIGVPVKIGGIPQEDLEKLFDEYHKVGQSSIDKFKERLMKSFMIPAEKGICASCKEEKKLVAEAKDDRRKYCLKCLKSYVSGSIARKEILPLLKRSSPLPLKTFVDEAFVEAQKMFDTWLKNNRKKLVEFERTKVKFDECKQRGTEREPENEPEEIKTIRKAWRESKKPMSIFRFFHFYWLGFDISRKNRKKRKERLRKLSEALGGKIRPLSRAELRIRLEQIESDIEAAQHMLKKTTSQTMKTELKEIIKELKKKRSSIKRKIRLNEGEMKVTEIANLVAKPVCEGCENFREYEWGYECELDSQRRPAKIPDFPKTRVQYSKGMYKFEKIENLWKLELPVWEKGKRRIAATIGAEWIEKRYEKVFSDTSKYLSLIKKGEGNGTKYFLIIPVTRVVPIEDEGWLHVIAYAPKTTCVLSIKEDQKKVKFFRHGEIISIKQYYEAQRQRASRGYFKKERRKERKKIRLVLHRETNRIVKYLKKLPGKVILLNFQKRLYRKKEMQRRELNRKLKYWSDSVFRSLIKYKLELDGFEVGEQKFYASKLARCPYCGAEVGGSWQDLMVVRRKYSLQCNCGRDTNANLAMAMIALKQT